MRSEHIDTRAILNGDPGDANLTDPKRRLEERAKVLDYWPDELIRQIRDGFLAPPPWRFLLDPTAWKDVDPGAVYEYVRPAVEYGHWPSLDNLRRKFGRVSNHRGADEVPEQASLFA